MDSITIRITEASDEGYMFDIWCKDAIDPEDDGKSDDGGQCTTTMLNALEMAYLQAREIITKADNA